MKRINANGVQLAVSETGEGEPLILVHGGWSDHRTWDPIVPALASSHRVLAYDRRGHGRSTRPAATRRDHEDDLGALIEELDAGPARLLGNSFGGSISLGLAVRRPDLVEAVTVHEPPLLSLLPDDPATAAELAEVGASIAEVLALTERGDDRAAARRFAEMVLGPGAWEEMPASLAETMVDTAQSFRVEQQDPLWTAIDADALATIECPVQLTYGGESPVWFRAIVEAIDELVDHAELREIAVTGHAPHETHPGEYVPVLRELLDRSPVVVSG